MDPDNRKSSDTAEAPKHFIDIDYYPDFHNLTRNLDSLIAQYGWPLVKQKGIVPWATVWTLDSLTAQLARGDWNRAYLTASDLGHYVADAHQPLHCTQNYNGGLTGNYGIHSRYETTMINTFSGSLSIVPDSVRYIEDPVNYVFDYVFHSQTLVDSIMQADTYAKAMSGWNGQGTPPSSYYSFLWERCRVYTIDQIQRATVVLASFWYTASVNAGLIPTPLLVSRTELMNPAQYSLQQNYPNPFNPLTVIRYTLSVAGPVTLKVYNVLGQEVAALVNEVKQAGRHEAAFDGSTFPSGVYFYRLVVGGVEPLHSGTFSETKKLLLLK